MNERTRRDSNGPPAALPSSSSPASSSRDSPPPPSEGHNRRSYERFEVTWSVDCETEDTFLYASITNISEMGIFVRTTDPLTVGTQLTLRFAPPAMPEAFVLRGMVQWVNAWRPTSDNPNPGMGIRFMDLTAADRERIVDTVRTIAYLRDTSQADN